MAEIIDIPQGNSSEEVAARRKIISNFFREWKKHNPLQMRYNASISENIYIRFVSITETCTHASRTYLSTLAVLRLDTILVGAKKVGAVTPKANANQKPFEKMLVMIYECPGIGIVKMTVGVRRRTHEKVMYCITIQDS